MVKSAAQDPRDPSLQMKVRQYLVSARKNPTTEDANPKVFSMRVFARNPVVAKTRFWWNLRRLNKVKRANGQILAVQELYERKTQAVKTYGIVLRYQSRTTFHNMYKEFRDTTLNGAISQLYQEMSGNHRANPNTIQIIRTSVVQKSAEVRRAYSNQYRVFQQFLLNIFFFIQKGRFFQIPHCQNHPQSQLQKIQDRFQSKTSQPIQILNNIKNTRKIKIYYQNKMSIKSSTDVKFNNIQTSAHTTNSNPTDLNTSTYSTTKLSQSISNGNKRFVPTEYYLSQLEQRYSKPLKIQQQQPSRRLHTANSSEFMLHHEDVRSHQSNYNKNDMPTKFQNKVDAPVTQDLKTQPQHQVPQKFYQIQQTKTKMPQVAFIATPDVSKLQDPATKVQLSKRYPQQQQQSEQQQQVQISPEPKQPIAMEYHIPNNISLSRGVSERSFNQ